MKQATFLILVIALYCNKLYSQKDLIDEYPLLTMTESVSVQKKLTEIKRTTGVEICCYIARTLDGKSPETFTLEKANAIKPGTPGINNSIFIMIAPAEQQLYITMSYGIQWIIPDTRTEDFIDMMAPFFRDKKYGEGILKGLEGLEKAVSGNSWNPVNIDFRNTDLSKYIGKVITFEYKTDSRSETIRPPVPADAEFDRNYKIPLFSDKGIKAELFYSKYMDGMIHTILNVPSVKIYARVRKVRPDELELLGITD